MNDYYPEFPKPEISFEFFPPRSAVTSERLLDAYNGLSVFQPKFVSVTYGALGSTQEGTLETVTKLQAVGASVVPHITGIGSTESQISALINTYLELGIERFVVLRGDLPEDRDDKGAFAYAEQLIRFLRQEFSADLHLEVAAYPEMHPESTDPTSELSHFKAKFDAGATSAITQYFYNADSYSNFVLEAERLGVDAPIVPGIMPIVSYDMMHRFAQRCGAEIPRWLDLRLQQYKDDDAAFKEFATEVVTQLCRDLIDRGVPGLHFYTLNQIEPIAQICERLGFVESDLQKACQL